MSGSIPFRGFRDRLLSLPSFHTCQKKGRDPISSLRLDTLLFGLFKRPCAAPGRPAVCRPENRPSPPGPRVGTPFGRTRMRIDAGGFLSSSWCNTVLSGMA